MTGFTVTGHLSSGCPAQTGEKESVSSSFSALKGEKKNLDYPTKRTQLPLRRGWGMHAAGCVGLSPVFHLLQRQRPMHTHGCSVYRRQQTPQGARGSLPCVSVLADVAAGSDRAGAARAPVAAGSQKSSSSVINASSLLA